jgi:hypothetical protein
MLFYQWFFFYWIFSEWGCLIGNYARYFFLLILFDCIFIIFLLLIIIISYLFFFYCKWLYYRLLQRFDINAIRKFMTRMTAIPFPILKMLDKLFQIICPDFLDFGLFIFLFEFISLGELVQFVFDLKEGIFD